MVLEYMIILGLLLPEIFAFQKRNRGHYVILDNEERTREPKKCFYHKHCLGVLTYSDSSLDCSSHYFFEKLMETRPVD